MPLFGMDKFGNLYEENSSTNSGMGKTKSPELVEEGSTVLGGVSKRHAMVNRHLQMKAKFAKQKAVKNLMIKAQAETIRKNNLKRAKNIQANQKAKRLEQVKNKKNKLYFQAANQIEEGGLGYEYSDLIGNPLAGFEGGEYVSNITYEGSDLDHHNPFGTDTIVNSKRYPDDNEIDEGFEGFKFKKPKFKFKKPKITIKKPTIKAPTTLKAVVKDIGKVAAKAATAPITMGIKVVKATPILKDVRAGVDKLTGGTLSKLDRIANLPNKAAAGKPISKGEIMEAVMTAVQVAAIVASGGSAAALIAAGAGMLKGGPLGQTSFGRNILTLAEIAGGAAAIQSAASSQLATQAATQGAAQGSNVAASAAASQVAKMTTTEAAKKALQQHVTNIVKSKVEEEFEKKTGIPVTIATKVYNIASGNAKIATLPKDILKKVGEEQLKKAGLGSSVTQAIMSNNASQLGVMIKDAPNLLMEKAKREMIAQKVKLQEYTNLEKLKAKVEAKVQKSVTSAKALELIQDKIEKAANDEVRKQLQKLMASKSQEMFQDQKESLASAQELELEQARASLKVAAAEEGRYEGGNFGHPMLRYFQRA